MGSGIQKFCRNLWAYGLLPCLVSVCVLFTVSAPAHAAAGINQQINFQGRLLNNQGAIVPDGYYNVEFKIYQDGNGCVSGGSAPCGGTLLWTEDYVDNNANAGVQVLNGYMSVQLGSICAFSGGSCQGHSNTGVNWNSDTLWLSMNIAGSNNACTTFGVGVSCTADGEMTPMKRLSANSYALNSQELGGMNSSQFVQLAQGLQTDATTSNSIYINKTGASGNLIDLQTSGADSFIVNNSGNEVFGANAGHSISVATAAASTAGQALTVSAGAAGSGASAISGGTLTLNAGAGGGTNGNGGNLVLDAGAPNGTGTAGTITIGSNNASSIQLGNAANTTQAKVQAGAATTTLTNNGGQAVQGADATNATNAMKVTNGSGSVLFQLIDDGGVNLGINPANGYAFGHNAIGANGQDSGFNGIVMGQKFTASSTTTIKSISVNIGSNVEAGFNSYQVGIYADNAGSPGSLIAASSVGTLTASSWNTLAVNASVTSGTAYWLAYTTNVQSGQGTANGTTITTGSSGDTHFFATFAFSGTMPASISSPTIVANTVESMYASSAAGPAVSISNNGNITTPTTFQNAANSTTALLVQNSLGNQVLDVDTTNSQVVLGQASKVNGQVLFQSSGGGNYVGFAAPTTNPNSSYVLALPSTAPSAASQCLETGATFTQLTFASCGGSSGSFINNQTTLQVGANFNIDGTGIAAVLEAPTFDAASAGALNIGKTSGGNANQINLNQNIQITGNTTYANGANRTISVAPASGAGNNLTVTAGNGGTNSNGGNLILQGGAGSGTGVAGLVVITTPTFQSITNDANCYTGGALVASSCTIAQSTIDGSSAVIVGFSAGGQTATLPAPTNKTAGRLFYIMAANGSQDFTLSVNGGGTGNTVAMRQNTSATEVWNGAEWGAAGASSSTDLQAAYDNTLQSAGGAELVVSKTSNTDGLNIRDSAVNSVNGALLTVQSSSAATLFAVNSNVTEYTTDSGAEVAGGTSSTFPASTWSAIGGTITRYTTVGSFIASGQGSVQVNTSGPSNQGVSNALNQALTANMHYNVSFAARLTSGTFTDLSVFYSVDGTTASVPCITNQIVTTSIWTKVNCTFAAPASGITSSNAILIRQGSPASRTFYVDNISVTISADFNLATDGGVDSAANFTTNWPAVGSPVATVTRSTTIGNDTSDSAQVVTGATAGQGVANKLSINPLTNTLYRITVYAATTTAGFNNFTVQYTRDGGTSFVNCTDYNTQIINNSTSSFTEVTCYITTDGNVATNPEVYFTQQDTNPRTFYVDTFSMTLSTTTTPNVQIGGGTTGGPVTLFTLDRAASAPIASNNDAFLGSMYFDTTLGELQCYESSGWGSCGSSPNTVVTISPEYTNAVMHGTGVGTMTSDICSGTLGINDGSGSQPTICGASETFNFYKWTSPQPTSQTYSIYVTYQLPDTFKSFASGQTTLLGRTDSTNSSVQYSIYRDDASTGLQLCGSAIPVSTGVSSSWQVKSAAGASDPSTCGFLPNESIVFKIDLTADQNANAYVSNLNFTFSHK